MLHWNVILITTPVQKWDVSDTTFRWARVLYDGERKLRHIQHSSDTMEVILISDWPYNKSHSPQEQP